METSPIGGQGKYRDLSPRLTIGSNSYVKNDLLHENEYQNTKLDIVANLRAVFKKPLNTDGTYKDSLHKMSDSGIRRLDSDLKWNDKINK